MARDVVHYPDTGRVLRDEDGRWQMLRLGDGSTIDGGEIDQVSHDVDAPTRTVDLNGAASPKPTRRGVGDLVDGPAKSGFRSGSSVLRGVASGTL
jgi:hypothetical protein